MVIAFLQRSAAIPTPTITAVGHNKSILLVLMPPAAEHEGI